MTATADFVVIGGGIAGAAAAYELAAHGSVTLLEREAVAGYHTTGRSAALYTEAYERGQVRILAMASGGLLRDPPDGFGVESILSPLPVMLIATEDQLEKIDDLAADAAGLVPLGRVDGPTASRMCPVLRPGYVAAALVEPGAMEIDVHALLQGFLSGARRRGARVLTGSSASTIERRGPRLMVTADGGGIEAPTVVNAAGAWCDVIAEAAGTRPLRLTPYRRTAFTFPVPGGVRIDDWPMVVDIDERFYFKPERGQFMGSLAEETPMPPHDVRPREIDVALAVERINAATTLDISHVRRTWAGLRTFAPDRLPVVGFDPHVAGLFWLAGQGGYGIMTAPAMARLAAGLITEGRVPRDLADAGLEANAVSPARFGS